MEHLGSGLDLHLMLLRKCQNLGMDRLEGSAIMRAIYHPIDLGKL